MRELPKEIEEAAFVDGATPWIIVRRVFLPLWGRPLVTTGLLAFIVVVERVPVRADLHAHQRAAHGAAGHRAMTGATAYELPWGTIMAASVIVTVPLIVLVLVFQRKIVAGLTAGAVKG